jgi:hypothetical protein
LSLTDDRVRWQRAPFDHPQLFVPDGASGDGTDNTISSSRRRERRTPLHGS